MIDLYFIEYDHTMSNDVLCKLKLQLPNNVISKCPQYKRIENIQEFLLGKSLLLYALYHHGYSINLLVNIKYNFYGKPTIDGVFFNISHTRNCVVCAFSITENIGVDIEKKRFIQKSIYQDNMNEIGNDSSFLKYWTVKEAVLKNIGVGLSLWDNIKIDYGKHQAEFKSEKFFFRNIDAFDNYFITISSSVIPRDVNIHVLQLSDIIFNMVYN